MHTCACACKSIDKHFRSRQHGFRQSLSHPAVYLQYYNSFQLVQKNSHEIKRWREQKFETMIPATWKNRFQIASWDVDDFPLITFSMRTVVRKYESVTHNKCQKVDSLAEELSSFLHRWSSRGHCCWTSVWSRRKWWHSCTGTSESADQSESTWGDIEEGQEEEDEKGQEEGDAVHRPLPFHLPAVWLVFLSRYHPARL